MNETVQPVMVKTKCTECNGHGHLRTNFKPVLTAYIKTCSNCDGEGFVMRPKAAKCH